VHPSLPHIVIRNRTSISSLYFEDEIINNKVGKLSDVFQKLSFSPTCKNVYNCFRIEEEYYKDNDSYIYSTLFVNWRLFCQTKNEQGRLPLFTALAQNLKWSDGLCKIWKNNGAAIEETDTVTGLEAFMLAAVGPYRSIETVFTLLRDHPAAINPYVIMTQCL